MFHRFEKDDVERLSRELGVSRQEAARYLHRAGGDYKKAVRLYIGEHNIFVEPEKVEDGKRSAIAEAVDFLKGACVRISRNRGVRTAFLMALILLALTLAPAIAVPAALIGLFMRLGRQSDRYTSARIVI